MSRLEQAAIKLHGVMWRNTGTNAEWPIAILCDDDHILDAFATAYNELTDAIEEVKPGSTIWPTQNEQ